MWRTWIPELAIEVVSESSRDRDYTEKRDEYWTLGVKEYWIVDAKLEQVLALRRGRSQWTEKSLGASDVCETKLLPGFQAAVPGSLRGGWGGGVTKAGELPIMASRPETRAGRSIGAQCREESRRPVNTAASATASKK